MKPPYTVEPAEESCAHCHRDRYVVVGPDGVAGGVYYNDRGDAEEQARELNDAFARGVASSTGLAEAVLSAALGHGITWDANSRTLGHDPGEGYVDSEDALAATIVHLIDLSRSGT